jgi:hypothetical protein
MNIPREHAIEDWDPRAYWSEYYEGDELESDERAMFDFSVRVMESESRPFGRMLDLGSGPTVHRLIPFTPFVDEIHVADFDPRNRAHVAAWVEGGDDALDWGKFFDLTLELENGSRAPAEPSAREAQLRGLISRVRHCDLRRPDPLGELDRYGLVTTFFCADCITTSRDRWRQFMDHALALVAPEGRVVLTALGESEGYPIGERMFPSADLTEDDLRQALVAAGFMESAVWIERAALPDDERRPYASLGYVLMATARRPARGD